MLYESILNLGALLTASLAHTSFEKAVGTSYSQVITIASLFSNNFLLILGVAVRFGKLIGD